jgi:hypothetical protein
MLTLQLIPWPFSLLHHLHYPVQHNSHSPSITMDRTFLGFHWQPSLASVSWWHKQHL